MGIGNSQKNLVQILIHTCDLVHILFYFFYFLLMCVHANMVHFMLRAISCATRYPISYSMHKGWYTHEENAKTITFFTIFATTYLRGKF